jgi:hypothetical protein
MIVYRISQAVSAEGEGKSGPVLSTEGFAETEILKSISGWVEVNNRCLVRIHL